MLRKDLSEMTRKHINLVKKLSTLQDLDKTSKLKKSKLKTHVSLSLPLNCNDEEELRHHEL